MSHCIDVIILMPHCIDVCCRLKHKIACKVNNEHYMVKDLQPPNETVAKLVAKTAIGGGPLSGRD